MKIRQLITGFAIGLLSVGVVPNAFGYAYAGWVSQGTVNGVSYQTNAYIDTASTPAGGGQIQGTNKNIPAGWAGVGAILYLNTAVCTTKPYSYNSTDVALLSNGVSANCGSGVYDATAAFQMWNGSTYNSVGQMSPKQNK